MGIDGRRWCVRATRRNEVTYPVSLHRWRWTAWRHARRLTEKERVRGERWTASGHTYHPVSYTVDRASVHDRAELDGYGS